MRVQKVDFNHYSTNTNLKNDAPKKQVAFNGYNVEAIKKIFPNESYQRLNLFLDKLTKTKVNWFEWSGGNAKLNRYFGSEANDMNVVLSIEEQPFDKPVVFTVKKRYPHSNRHYFAKQKGKVPKKNIYLVASFPAIEGNINTANIPKTYKTPILSSIEPYVDINNALLQAENNNQAVTKALRRMKVLVKHLGMNFCD